MVRIPTERSPTHPGVMLLEEFLKPLGITQSQLATRSECRTESERAGQRPARDDAIHRAAPLQDFGTSAGFWMNLQLRWDLYRAQAVEARVLRGIRPIRAAN